jgi:hypothetical protein
MAAKPRDSHEPAWVFHEVVALLRGLLPEISNGGFRGTDTGQLSRQIAGEKTNLKVQ